VILLPCDKCQGRGTIDLPAHLQETYDAVARGIQTAPEIHALAKDNDGFGITAINRRLEQLIYLGLVVRTTKRRGKAFLYEAKLQQQRKQNGRGHSKT
jgi:hypothetical protein